MCGCLCAFVVTLFVCSVCDSLCNVVYVLCCVCVFVCVCVCCGYVCAVCDLLCDGVLFVFVLVCVYSACVCYLIIFMCLCAVFGIDVVVLSGSSFFVLCVCVRVRVLAWSCVCCWWFIVWCSMASVLMFYAFVCVGLFVSVCFVCEL